MSDPVQYAGRRALLVMPLAGRRWAWSSFPALRWQTLLRLRIPSALPYSFGDVRISSGLALIGAVTAEFVAGRIGRLAWP